MYCPRCGQQQVSAELRFCSRCGLPLALVAEVVSHGGTLPQLEQISANTGFWTRSNGLKFGLAWFLILTFLITPLLAVLDLDDGVAVTAILGFMGGILIIVFSLLFLRNEPKTLSTTETNIKISGTEQSLGAGGVKNALPPQQTMPTTAYVPPGSWQSDTDDLQPTSVTEETTKLLNKEE